MARSYSTRENGLNRVSGIWIRMLGALDDTAFFFLADVTDEWDTESAKVSGALDQVCWMRWEEH